ncbi:MAG: ATPase [Clostridium lundense]|nr:ATPase [Clostridium lundense]
MTGRERHLFPGSNTPLGPYFFFNYIIPTKEARRVIYFKGGPGTGKSSAMKKIGNIFQNRGYDVEYFHCSSDNESLDAILIKGLNVALIDGTAPHMQDPVYPGAVDETFNLGVCLDEKGLSSIKEELYPIYADNSRSYKRGFSYFKAAAAVHEDWRNYNLEALDEVKLNDLKKILRDKIFKDNVLAIGKERHLFCTALTPNGIITFIDELVAPFKNVYVLNGDPGTGKTEVLNFLKDEALKRGFFVEIFHDVINPNRIEHIFIPDLDVAIVTSNEVNRKSFEGENIQMADLLNKDYLDKYKAEIQKDEAKFYDLLHEGLQCITKCKKIHDVLEAYYVSNINFETINVMVDELVQRLISYEK